MSKNGDARHNLARIKYWLKSVAQYAFWEFLLGDFVSMSYFPMYFDSGWKYLEERSRITESGKLFLIYRHDYC